MPWMTVFQFTNYFDASQFSDTTIVSGLWFGQMIQTFSSGKYALSVMANIGVEQEDIRQLRDFNIDCTQTYKWKKIQVSQSLQAIKRFYGNGTLIGGGAGMQYNLVEKLSIGLKATYLAGVSQTENSQYYFNTFINWKF